MLKTANPIHEPDLEEEGQDRVEEEGGREGCGAGRKGEGRTEEGEVAGRRLRSIAQGVHTANENRFVHGILLHK